MDVCESVRGRRSVCTSNPDPAPEAVVALCPIDPLGGRGRRPPNIVP